MKNIICLIVLLIMTAIHPSLSQQRDTLKQYRANILAQRLSIDNGKAVQLLAIQDTYKETVKKLLKDLSQSSETRKNRIIQLEEQKNSAIKAMLTPEQQSKMPGLNHAVHPQGPQSN